MKTRNKKHQFKRFLVGGMLALSVFSTSFLVSNFEKQNFEPVFANYQAVESSISNSDFSSYSTSTTPYSPNNWTFNNPLNNDSIKNGVINVYDTTFADNKSDYELSENPNYPAGNPTSGSSDALYKHLMINSYAGFGRAGYSSGSFTLDANSYYSVSVTLRTNDQAKAAIYVSGLSDSDVKAEITNISTFDTWETYTLFIETNQFTSENANLELWLGSKEVNDTCEGAVFFNKVVLTKYSKTTFDKNIANSDVNTTKVVSLFNPTYVTDAFKNSSFNDSPAPGEANIIPGWTTIESAHNDTQMLKVITTDNYNPEIDTETGIANPGTNYQNSDNSILFMYNKESGYQGIKSNEFTIEQNELYMISVWAKSDCATGNGATIMLEQVNEDEEDEDFTAKTASVTTATSVTTNASTNGWTQYKLFVEGHPLQNTKATLQIWLGTKESATNGYVFVDDISVQKISYATYSTGTTDTSNHATYSYNSENTQFTIVNGNFNIAQKPEDTLTYPLTVANWTQTKEDSYDDDQNLTGVINTNSSQFALLTNQINNKNLGVTVTNPGLTPVQQINDATLENSSNNVLMIGNTIETSQSYKSDNFSLTASNYYKISMLVNTQFSTAVSNNNAGVEITLANTSFTALNVKNINTDGEWKKVTYYVHVGASNTEFNLTLALNNIQGFAFFDDVQVFESSETEFNANKNGLEYKTNLDIETFDSFDLHETSDTYPLTQLYNWTATNNAETNGVEYGALDTSKNTSNVFAGINNPQAVTGNSVLAIHSNTDTHFTMTANQKIDISMDSYYEISVKVKTVNISQENKKYDEDGNLISYGAFISLNGYENSFTAINTERDEIDGYATYTFLIKPTADAQTFIELGLGSENNLASGYVFFDDVQVNTLEEAAYNEKVDAANIRTLVLGDQAVETDKEETGTEFSGSQFDWVLVPSLLTSLAIIIAIVGATVRRFKFTKKPKIKTKYDRRKTVEVDLSKRERIELRNEIIKELNSEYSDIDGEINALVKQFEFEKAEAKRLQEEKLRAYEQIKQTIILDREKATREYNDKLNATETLTEKEKAKYEKEFKTYMAKLDKRASLEAKKVNKKDNTLELLEAKHAARLKALQERKRYIEEEIARIEREIEEIAKQEEIMWNEYRKAKEEAKKQKLAYLAERRKEKEEAKARKRASKQEETLEETNSTEVETENSEQTVENTEENKQEENTSTEVEIVEPDDKKE